MTLRCRNVRHLEFACHAVPSVGAVAYGFIYKLLLQFTDPPFIAQETLRAWQKKNHPWLELSDVHRETTEGVRVTVIPFYMGSRESQNSAVYWVRFTMIFI